VIRGICGFVNHHIHPRLTTLAMLLTLCSMMYLSSRLRKSGAFMARNRLCALMVVSSLMTFLFSFLIASRLKSRSAPSSSMMAWPGLLVLIACLNWSSVKIICLGLNPGSTALQRFQVKVVLPVPS